MKTRLDINDSMLSAVTKMAEGNPGAVTVLIRIMNESSTIDPNNALGGLGTILSLDTFGIYGSRIWMLYKYVCKHNLSHMLALLRGCQLGYLSQEQLAHAINNYGEGINIADICAKVVERLPQFKLTA